MLVWGVMADECIHYHNKNAGKDVLGHVLEHRVLIRTLTDCMKPILRQIGVYHSLTPVCGTSARGLPRQHFYPIYHVVLPPTRLILENSDPTRLTWPLYSQRSVMRGSWCVTVTCNPHYRWPTSLRLPKFPGIVVLSNLVKGVDHIRSHRPV
ncbi:Monooxygenase [Phytophthora megakarya]|uniref:Monooxygenase n=1 Tax=Phytophthora megakarya TaxID=4795 RepID=A0A225W1Y8_9STRA|nr:Monooxygenase [Phytophthora megakarya]